MNTALAQFIFESNTFAPGKAAIDLFNRGGLWLDIAELGSAIVITAEPNSTTLDLASLAFEGSARGLFPIHPQPEKPIELWLPR